MKRFLLFVIAVVLVVYGIHRWDVARREQSFPASFTPAATPGVDLKEVPVLAAMDQEYTRLAEAVMPSVVSLYTSRRISQRPTMDPFEFFFGRQQRRPVPREFIQNSLGSGVIVSAEGHILTNNHVIADMDEIKVRLRDGREFPAKVIGADESVDIAVLQISAPNLKPLAMGDSDKVKVGSLVLAIGNPFGLQETVTHGMISATGRQVFDESTTDFFQTDTAINPGNSGGPLVNLGGEIIGINTAIGNFSGSGTWQGVGFAIPINVARRSMESILKTGRAVHGYLGVAIQTLTPELAEQFGVPGRTGALVDVVTPDSPAEKAGLRRGDIIVAVDGEEVPDLRRLLRRVASAEVGSKLSITTIREGKETTVEAVIEEQPEDFRISVTPKGQRRPAPVPPGEDLPEDNPLAGLRIGPIPERLLPSLPENVSGVMVLAVRKPGPLRPGDVIEEVGRQPVPTPEQFLEVAGKLSPGERVLLSICRGRERSFVVVTP